MKTCLIVIDAQESFRQRPYFTDTDLPAYLAAQNALIDGCVAQGVPIVRVFHVDGPKLASNAFALESGFVKPLAELKTFEAAATFHKSRHSALVGTGLDVWLIAKRHPETDHQRHSHRAMLRNHHPSRLRPGLARGLLSGRHPDLGHAASGRYRPGSRRHQGAHCGRAERPFCHHLQRAAGAGGGDFEQELINHCATPGINPPLRDF